MRRYRHFFRVYRMKKITFVKMVASGNDFVVVDHRFSQKPALGSSLKSLARKICDRRQGVGSDGLLVIESIRGADARMRIINSDGSEAEMCGNGARCAALFLARHTPKHSKKKLFKIQTQAGIIQAEVSRDKIKVGLTAPKEIKEDLSVRIAGRMMRVNFINTGVPHVVVFGEGLDKIDVKSIGRQLRYHKRFMPRGTNADFVEVKSGDSIAIRTYERGVEDETLACGTGSVAGALIFALKSGCKGHVRVQTRSGQVLKVYFDRIRDKIRNVWLEGEARIVYKGVYNV